ncbi:hypothetical protein ACLOJK_021550 [Asimina triloba]
MKEDMLEFHPTYLAIWHAFAFVVPYASPQTVMLCPEASLDRSSLKVVLNGVLGRGANSLEL